MKNLKKALAAAAAFFVLLSCMQALAAAADAVINVDVKAYTADSVNVGKGNGTEDAESGTVTGGTYRQFFSGTKAIYAVTAETAGLYRMEVTVGASNNAGFELYVGGIITDSGTIAGAGNWDQRNVVLSQQIPLAAGANTLEYRGTSSGINVYAIKLTWVAPLPETVAATAYSSYSGSDIRTDCVVNWANSWTEYTLNITKTGMYRVNGDLAVNAASSTCIMVDGVILVEKAEITGSGWTKQTGVALTDGIPLTAGTHVIRFYTISGNIMHYNFTFTYAGEIQNAESAYLAPSVALMMYPTSTSVTNPNLPNKERTQLWTNNKCYFRVNLDTGMYRVKLLTNVSEAYPAAVTVTVDDSPVAENMKIEAQYATDSPESAFYEVTLSESFQIRSGQHIIKVASVGSKFFYFRRLIIEKVGEVEESALPNSISQPAINFDYAAGEGVGFHDNNDAVDNESTQYACFTPVDVNMSNASVSMFQGEWLRYSINVARAGWYDLAANYGIAGGNTTLSASTGNQNISGIGPDTGSYNTFGDVTVGTLYLNEGDNQIIIKNSESACLFMGFTLTKTDAVKLFKTDGETETQITVPEEGTLRAKAGVNFETGGILIAAAYKNKELISISNAVSFAAGPQIVTADLSNVPEGAVVKVFTLSDLDNVIPLDKNTDFGNE